MLFRSENFDFVNTIDLVKITISPIKLYCGSKNRRQGPKTAGYHRQPAAILNPVHVYSRADKGTHVFFL